ncbi:N-formylglutamate amidohydrolase [Oceanibaculum pacificum]|uniref:N-formylglutamate amidohydrolase n=1 Tax=Oceanibaculum pacificum TaxID=580166 RepID=UPI000A052548|nr:N-formylglutamate amidohydrolase [Oceanibaculum pacificum]
MSKAALALTGEIGRSIPNVLVRRDPGVNAAPVVFDIPRSGFTYPRDFQPDAQFVDVQRGVSMYVEELYGGAPAAGANWLFAEFPNSYIDANRHQLDIDPKLIDGEWPEPLKPTRKSELGIGLIHSVCRTGDLPLYSSKLAVEDVQHRLDAYYWPYHNELSDILKRHRAAKGVAYHVSCHSMASIGGHATIDHGSERSEFDIGDGNGKTCKPEFVELVVETLRGFGHQVTVNKHYAGAESIHKHADPANGIHSLQIEIKRGIYMDERKFIRSPRFAEIRGHLDQLAQAICAYAGR